MSVKDSIDNWTTVETFVCTYPDGQSSDDPDGACDVEVQIGSAGSVWYLRTQDDAGGPDDCDDTSYDTEDEAAEAAEAFAASHNEADAGEDAEAYLARMTAERAGEPDDEGDYCVWWETVDDDECGVHARYATQEQAEAACEIANDGLHKHNPSQLLCGYQVRVVAGDDWIAVSY
jgi:hypothetical protein